MVFLRIMLPEEEEETKVAFGRGNSGGRGSKLFIYCAFTNHTVDECYRKHGYLPRHKLYKSLGSNINNISAEKEESDSSAQ